ncbi:hypothetical protein D3C77_432400 [compost metagenome]
MALAKTEQRPAGIDIFKPIMVISDFPVIIVAVGRADQRCFPAVMDVIVRDCNILGIFLHVDQPVIIVFVGIQSGIQLIVIHPDVIGRTFNTDRVLVANIDMVDFQIADDNIAGTRHFDAYPIKFSSGTHAQDRDVIYVLDADFIVRGVGRSDFARYINRQRLAAFVFERCLQRGPCGDRNGSTPGSPGCSAIQSRKPNIPGISCLRRRKREHAYHDCQYQQ